MNYSQLNNEERNLIDFLWNKKQKHISQIAIELNKNKSTISREIKRNTRDGYYWSKQAQYKSTFRKRHKYFFNLMKYENFTKLFLKFYNKYNFGVKATWNKILKMNLNILIPSWRQVFNWINGYFWVVKRSDRLRRKYRKGEKRKIGIFSKFKNKYVLPIWLRPKFIDKRQQ